MNKRVLITGATGLVGNSLVEYLFTLGYDDVRVLTRNKKKAKQQFSLPIEAFEWDLRRGFIEKGALEGVDCIFHLAGENVADGRWTQSKKDRILKSRKLGTDLLLKEITEVAGQPMTLISASAIGIYGDRGEEKLDEGSSLATKGFLPEVCKVWEDCLHKNEIKNLKVYSVRVGLVLSQKGGALQKMLPAFQFGVGGALGAGDQYMSWIHIGDLLRQFVFLMEKEPEGKVFNGVSPQPVQNREFTKSLGRVLKRPTFFSVPKIALNLALGEMSQILMQSQRVFPAAFEKEGFEFHYSNLTSALKQIILKKKFFEQQQWMAQPVSSVFQFFSDEKNLEKITPPHLHFKVLKKSTPEIQEGTLIDYKLKIRGVPVFWRTKIKKFQKDDEFIDEQLKGPYSKWVHTHKFYATKRGTLMVDCVDYRLPFGILGHVVAGWYVKRDVSSIFKYRKKVIAQTFE